MSFSVSLSRPKSGTPVPTTRIKKCLSFPIVKTESFSKEILEQKLVKTSFNGTSVEYEILVKKKI